MSKYPSKYSQQNSRYGADPNRHYYGESPSSYQSSYVNTDYRRDRYVSQPPPTSYYPGQYHPDYHHPPRLSFYPPPPHHHHQYQHYQTPYHQHQQQYQQPFHQEHHDRDREREVMSGQTLSPTTTSTTASAAPSSSSPNTNNNNNNDNFQQDYHDFSQSPSRQSQQTQQSSSSSSTQQPQRRDYHTDEYSDYGNYYPPHSRHQQYSEEDSRYYDADPSRGDHYSSSSSYPLEENLMVYEVRFKCTKDTYRLDPQCSHEILVGDTVVVETDRGYDAGVITTIQPADIPMGSMYANPLATLRPIIARASDDELEIIKENRMEEERALQLCRHLSLMRHLPIVVAATEMQFDRRKLTVIFSADRRVDFRELVRDMFQVFKTRIWMQKVSPTEAAALSILYPTAPLPAQGLPIPQTRSLVSLPTLTAESMETYANYEQQQQQQLPLPPQQQLELQSSQQNQGISSRRTHFTNVPPEDYSDFPPPPSQELTPIPPHSSGSATLGDDEHEHFSDLAEYTFPSHELRDESDYTFSHEPTIDLEALSNSTPQNVIQTQHNLTEYSISSNEPPSSSSLSMIDNELKSDLLEGQLHF